MKRMPRLRRDGGTAMVMSAKQFRSVRPSRNIIVVCLWVVLGFVSTAQLFSGVSPDSVNTVLDTEVQDYLAWSIIVVCGLNLIAAIVRHDGLSLGIEIGATVFGTGGFFVYALIIMDTSYHWWTLAGWAWATGLFIGCLLRAVQIFRRGY